MHPLAVERYKVFPPRWKNLRLPSSSRAAALSTLALWSPCRRKALLLQRLGAVVIRTAGVRALPGALAPWDPPWDVATGAQMAIDWTTVVGDFDSVGVYERPQTARNGLALLLFSAGHPVAFLKMQASEVPEIHQSLRQGHDALRMVDAAPTTAFVHPRPLKLGRVGHWSYLMTSVLTAGLDRPAISAAGGRAVVADIKAGLAQLPRGDDVPSGWEPMHGDLTPWNLRVRGDGLLTLVDWEDAGWGPPAADAVLLHASWQALYGLQAPRLPREAAEYWLHRIASRPPDPLDNRMRADMVTALRSIADGR
ncbi:hypothetical protein BH23ACT9_BH23ACT9_28970 [soil metagenome]